METGLEALFGVHQLEIDCPHCPNRFSTDYAQVLYNNRKVQCPSCLTFFRVEPKEDLASDDCPFCASA